MEPKIVLVAALSFFLLIGTSQASYHQDSNDEAKETRGIFQANNIYGLINLAKTAVQKCLDMAKSGAGKTGVVKTCIEVLQGAKGNLDDTGRSMRARKIEDAKTHASAALTNVDTCKDESEGSASRYLVEALNAAESNINKVLQNIK